VRKLINWLTTKTAEGDLFEIDTALRPNGNSGLLVTTFDAYAKYQQQRGSNTAWTWEHQAMTRARFVLGEQDMAPPSLAPGGSGAGARGRTAQHPAATEALVGEAGVGQVHVGGTRVGGVRVGEPSGSESSVGESAGSVAGGCLRERFDAVRHAVITAPRDFEALRGEIVAMRQKVGAAHPVKAGRFDVKHSRGAMVDVEFAVQFLVLAQSSAHSELVPNVGNIALLQRAEACALLPAGLGRAAADAYRELRRVQHQARLNEEPTHVPEGALAAEREAVRALWQAVFG